MSRLRSSRKFYERFRKAYRKNELKKLSKEQWKDSKSDQGRASKEDQRAYLRDYVRWLWRYWPSAVVLMVLSLFMAILEMVHPLFLRFVLDDVLLSDQLSSDQQLSRLHVAGGVFLSVIVVQQIISVFRDYRTRQMNVRVIVSLRRALFDRLLHLPLNKLTDMKTGGVISRITGDVDMTTGLLQMGLISPGVSLVRLIIALGAIFWLNWRLALTAIGVIPVAMLVSFVVSRRVRPIYRNVRDDASNVNARVGETFGGIRIVRGFQREDLEEINHAVGRHTIVRKRLFAHRRELALWTVWGLMLASVGLVTVWYGGYLHIQGVASIGDIMAFQFYTLLLLNPVWQIVNSFSELQRSLAAMERVFEVLGLPEDKPDVEEAMDAPRRVDEIRFENVSFSYDDDTTVLHNLEMKVPGGSVVALVGRSGAGKTTVTDLVARFYDPTEGSISVNGIDVRNFKLRSYRDLLGIVQQDVFLFDGTVRENIAYGRSNATDDEIFDAARRANADEFIEDLPDGYDSMIGERGVKLSGGQAQRLSIARAILADPQILIMDEATSSLDSESEQLIQASIQELLQGRTTFVIAHRLSTITDADMILVLEEGAIVERGKHLQLMAANGLYAEMVRRQQQAMQYEAG